MGGKQQKEETRSIKKVRGERKNKGKGRKLWYKIGVYMVDLKEKSTHFRKLSQ